MISHLGSLAVTRTAMLDGKVAGVAIWVPPGKWPYPPMIQVRQVFGALWAFLPDVGSLGRGGRILRVGEQAHPRVPQWYLQLLMVDPDVQRQGIGGLLQAPTLEQCDREGLPAWLETQKEENLAYYRGSASSSSREHHPVEDGPSMWSLRREPQDPVAQPTEPSICSSISRLHSTAYSIGSVRVIGSMKPFTIIPIAWDSVSPRLMR